MNRKKMTLESNIAKINEEFDKVKPLGSSGPPMNEFQKSQIETVVNKQAEDLNEAENDLRQSEMKESEELEDKIAQDEAKALAELKQKQETEKAARAMNPEELRLLGAAHQAQLEELEEQNRLAREKQSNELGDRLKKIRESRLKQLKEDHQMELKEEKDRLIKEIDEENRANALEDEKKAIEQIMSSNNNVTGAKAGFKFLSCSLAPDFDYGRALQSHNQIETPFKVVELVLKDRHAKEIAELEKTWDIELEKRLELELTDDMTPEEKQNKESLIRNEVKLAHAKARFQIHTCSLALKAYIHRFQNCQLLSSAILKVKVNLKNDIRHLCN